MQIKPQWETTARSLNWLILKTLTIPSVVKDMEPSHIVTLTHWWREWQVVQPHWRTVGSFLYGYLIYPPPIQ